MRRAVSMSIISFSLLFAACSVMEQYHFPQTQDKIPVDVLVVFSQKYPNLVIKSVMEQKMFDGSVRFAFLTTDSNNVERTVTLPADIKPAADTQPVTATK